MDRARASCVAGMSLVCALSSANGCSSGGAGSPSGATTTSSSGGGSSGSVGSKMQEKRTCDPSLEASFFDAATRRALPLQAKNPCPSGFAGQEESGAPGVVAEAGATAVRMRRYTSDASFAADHCKQLDAGADAGVTPIDYAASDVIAVDFYGATWPELVDVGGDLWVRADDRTACPYGFPISWKTLFFEVPKAREVKLYACKIECVCLEGDCQVG